MNEHYKQLPSGIFEPIEIWMRNGLNACAGNMLKYMARFPYKGTPYQDWVKVRDYYEIWGNKIDILPIQLGYERDISWCRDSIDFYSDAIVRRISDKPLARTVESVLKCVCKNVIVNPHLFGCMYDGIMTGDYMRPYLPIVPQPKQFESNDGC